MAVDIPEDCEYFLNSINRRGLIKPSDIIFLSCIASWRVYQMIMDNSNSKAYFLACKSQRLVFVKCLFIYIENNNSYSGLFRTTCIRDHSFQTMVKETAEKFFNVMTKNFVSEINSITNNNKKRKPKSVSSENIKIRKLQSEN